MWLTRQVKWPIQITCSEVSVAKPVLRVIIGSTRPGRVGPSVAAWITERAIEHGGFDVQVTDLAELNLPMIDEPNHPRLRKYVHEHTKDWSALRRGLRRLHLRDAGVQPRLQRGAEERDRLPLPRVGAQGRRHSSATAGSRPDPRHPDAQAGPHHASSAGAEAVNIPFVAQYLDEDKRFKSTELMDAGGDCDARRAPQVDGVAAGPPRQVTLCSFPVHCLLSAGAARSNPRHDVLYRHHT